MRWFLKCPNVQFEKFVNMPSYLGRTCLICAVEGNHMEIVKRLLRIKEIDVNKGSSDGWNPLHCACESGYLEIARVKSFSYFHYLN